VGPRRTEGCGVGNNPSLFGFLLLFHLLYLSALVFNFLLLLIQLALCLLILYLPVLQFIADDVSTASPERAAYRSSCAGMAHGGTDYRPGASTQQGADASTFFALAERLSRTSCYQQGRRERQCRRS
jgi:hypothetical protein